MHRNDRSLKAALAAAERLPRMLRRRLAERLVAETAPSGSTTVVYLQRLPDRKRRRLALLMDKSNEGRLTPPERLESRRLGAEVERMLVTNSEALARALRPELFDERGRPIRRRLLHAVRQTPPRAAGSPAHARA
jgi:hypothetical protein